MIFGGAGFIEGNIIPTPTAIEGIVESINQNLQQPQGQLSFGGQLMISAITVLGGVVVYVIGQIITKFYIEPIHEQRKVVGEISDKLMFYGNKLNPYFLFESFGTNTNNKETDKVIRRDLREKKKLTEEISDDIRKLGSLLVAKTYLIPRHVRFAFISEENIIKAKRSLTALSNSVGTRDHKEQTNLVGEIRKALGLIDPDNAYFS